MALRSIVVSLVLAGFLVTAGAPLSWGGQVWTKCHVTCRCLQNNSVANFSFALPVDVSPDTGFDADRACKSYGYNVCLDCCNSAKFSYTYQVTSP